MILFIILVLMALLLMAFLIGAISVIGSVGIVVFGDVIVCLIFIGLIIYHFIRK